MGGYAVGQIALRQYSALEHSGEHVSTFQSTPPPEQVLMQTRHCAGEIGHTSEDHASDHLRSLLANEIATRFSLLSVAGFLEIIVRS
jgi:hypothetical protein